MPDEIGGIETGEFFFPDRKGDDRDVIGRNTCRGQLLVKPDIGVTVDGGDHAHLLAIGAECDDVSHDLGPVGMTEGRIIDKDVVLSDALFLEVALKNIVRRARIDIVRAEQREFLNTQFFQEIIGRGDRLLVGRGAGVEHVFRALLALVLDRVEKQAVQLFDHWKDGFARHARPAAKHHVDLRDGQ